MNLPAPQPQSTTAARVYTLIGVAVATAALYLAKEILIPIALAVLLSFLLFPLVLWMERRGIKRVFAVVITVVVLMCAIAGLGYLLAGQFAEFVNNLPAYRKNIVHKIHAVKPSRESIFKKAEEELRVISAEMESETTGTVEAERSTGTEADIAMVSTMTAHLAQPDDDLKNRIGLEPEPEPGEEVRAATGLEVGGDSRSTASRALPVRIVEGPGNTWQTFTTMVGPVVTILGNFGLVVLFVIFFLLQREDLRDRVIRLAGTNQVRVTTEALEEAASRVSRYLLMQLIVNVTYGIPVALGLWIIGVPNALLWGALAIILRFIPYVGPWLAASMPIALSLAVFDNWTMPLITVGLFIVLELISNNIMEPILYGSSTGVSPVAIIISAVFWTWLWGPVGLVLATPITVCLVVLGGYIPQLGFLRVLLGDEPVLDDDARIYNRLLSGATDEAEDIVEEYLEEHELSDLFDDVMLRVLESAETDRIENMLSDKRYRRLILGMDELLDAIEEKLNADEAEETGEPNKTPRVAIMPSRRIACVPVNDETDKIAGDMLERLLAKRGGEFTLLPSGQLVSEVISRIAEMKPDVIVLSSVPPFEVTQTRYLAKRLSREFPDTVLYAGLWAGGEKLERVDNRLKAVGVQTVFTRLTQAAQHI